MNSPIRIDLKFRDLHDLGNFTKIFLEVKKEINKKKERIQSFNRQVGNFYC